MKTREKPSAGPNKAPKRRRRPFNPERWRILAFVDAYRQHFDCSKAAIAAGYSAHSARSTGSDLLKEPKIQALLAERSLSTVAAVNVKVEDVLRALSEIAYLDPAECFDAVSTGKGLRLKLKDLHTMPVAVRRCISSFKVTRQNVTTGDGEMDDVLEVKFWSKIEALAMLGKHLGMLNTVIEQRVTVEHFQKQPVAQLVADQRQDLERLERHLAAQRRLRAAAEEAPVSTR